MTDHLWLNAIIIIGMIGAAEEAIRRIVGRPLMRAWRKFEKFLDAWVGEPARDGLPARPGVVDRIIAIEYQVHNNGGGSLKDTVDEIARAAKVSATMATEAAEVANANKAALDGHIAQSNALIEQGAADKAALWLEAERHAQTISDLAKAVQIAAQSTPPEEMQ